jgi:hypothetical protein
VDQRILEFFQNSFIAWARIRLRRDDEIVSMLFRHCFLPVSQ